MALCLESFESLESFSIFKIEKYETNYYTLIIFHVWQLSSNVH